MVGTFEGRWLDAVVAACDPVFEAADVGFARQVMRDGDAVQSILWEAEAVEFAERYPDSGIIESYGDQWPAPCIDYWVYVDSDDGTAHLSVEGWGLTEKAVPLSGDGAADGRAIASIMAGILRVPPPG